MALLDRLQRRFGRYAVPNVTLILIAGQVALYVAGRAQPQVLEKAALIPQQVFEGEVWRLISFVFQPPLEHPILAFFFWYLFYLMGTALEHTWGTFRYNVYLLVGYVATVAVSFLTPDAPASVAFLQGSVFLAFAYLYPNFQLMLMFILPVKVKWLAILTWIGYFFALAFGSTLIRLLVAASVCNFVLFFGKDILVRIRSGHRRMVGQARQVAAKNKPRHQCSICGITNLSHPEMEFRYCSKCDGSPCYCQEHLRDHAHIVSTTEK